MGLDMYIYRVSKPNLDDTVIYNYVDLNGIVLDDGDLDKPMYRQLAPYAQQIQVRTQCYDMDKIRRDYELSNDSYISMRSSYRIVITDRKSGKMVDISSDVIERDYIVEKVEKRFVCNKEEVAYWRKAYDIQNWFYEHIEDGVENTGYYILPGELLLKFNKVFKEDRIEAESPDEESALFYWEWY